MKIAVFGLGYVGAVSAACLAQDGHQVIGVDPNATKLKLINAGQSPIIEKDVGGIIERTVASGDLRAVADAATAINDSDLSLVCVGTPSSANGSLDLRYVEIVCSEIGMAINVSLARLVGANRDYILNHIPRIAGLMVDSAEQLMRHAEVLVVGNGAPEFSAIVATRNPDQHVIDLVRIDDELDGHSAGYEGIAW
jgi:threonine dehydrogenase-like Zn-dependent dehydrogenase